MNPQPMGKYMQSGNAMRYWRLRVVASRLSRFAVRLLLAFAGVLLLATASAPRAYAWHRGDRYDRWNRT